MSMQLYCQVIDGRIIYSSTPTAQKTGCELIAEERRKQFLAGHDAACDDLHDGGELADAAACYAHAAGKKCDCDVEDEPALCDEDGNGSLAMPYAIDWIASKDPIAQLARAGAFCAAEIDRLMRHKTKQEAEARTQPRRFKYCAGCGVFDPKTGKYAYIRSDGGTGVAGAESSFWGFSWLDGVPACAL